MKVAATQMSCTTIIDENIKKAEDLVRKAAKKGAKVILLQELFNNVYFCQEEREEYYDLAVEEELCYTISYFRKVAEELKVVLPISFFEKCNNAYYNSLVMIDADGEVLGKYRKIHIPDSPGYKEKFYFTPGDLGFKVFETKYAKIGVGICWDQWFPETARILTLMGAELILYPTAIGTEPTMPEHDSMPHWQRTMQGHSAANIIPVVASNRVGIETIGNSTIEFGGASFITNHFGEKISEMDRKTEGVLVGDIDLVESRKMRAFWGIFRDRRPMTYETILSKDGVTKA